VSGLWLSQKVKDCADESGERCSGGVARLSIAALTFSLGGQSSSSRVGGGESGGSRAVDRGFKSGPAAETPARSTIMRGYHSQVKWAVSSVITGAPRA